MKTTSVISEEAARLYEKVGGHLLSDDKPSEALGALLDAGEFDAFPFDMLKKLRDTEQSPVHHPEGSVLNHTLLVVDEAAKRKNQSKDPAAFMWAALLHDIGKPAATRRRGGKITAYDHDKVGARLTRKFLEAVTGDARFIDRVAQLVRYHMQILYVVNNLPFQDIEGMKRHADVREIALLGLCDRLGRTGARAEDEEKQVQQFLRRCGVQPDGAERIKHG
jgi:putative nucleotidyltransferase with HDIG domain